MWPQYAAQEQQKSTDYPGAKVVMILTAAGKGQNRKRGTMRWVLVAWYWQEDLPILPALYWNFRGDNLGHLWWQGKAASVSGAIKDQRSCGGLIEKPKLPHVDEYVSHTNYSMYPQIYPQLFFFSIIATRLKITLLGTELTYIYIYNLWKRKIIDSKVPVLRGDMSHQLLGLSSCPVEWGKIHHQITKSWRPIFSESWAHHDLLNCLQLHPGRLTWNLQITHLERNMIFQTSMIMFHVDLPGCSKNSGNNEV